MTTTTLFPTHLGIYDVKNSEALNQELLNIDGLASNKFSFRNYIDLWQYKDQHHCLQILYEALLENAVKYANDCYGLDYRSEYFTVLEGWATSSVNRTIGQNRLHNHRLTDLAAVYYVNVSDDTGDIEFFDPRGGLGFLSLNSAKAYNVHAHRPKAGQMILFPGWLLHQVQPNNTNLNRVVIATNIKLNDDVRYKI